MGENNVRLIALLLINLYLPIFLLQREDGRKNPFKDFLETRFGLGAQSNHPPPRHDTPPSSCNCCKCTYVLQNTKWYLQRLSTHHF